MMGGIDHVIVCARDGLGVALVPVYNIIKQPGLEQGCFGLELSLSSFQKPDGILICFFSILFFTRSHLLLLVKFMFPWRLLLDAFN